MSNKKFTEWIEEQNACDNKDNIFDPAMRDSIAIQFLKDYLLGEDWYITDPVGPEQANTQIVYEILCKYSKKFKKELKRYNRWRYTK